jgi:alkanesulfonate monooxygenase SsuD/methylene tetrahydromethanopterin reductase-like flavin-dependent oxidoreductase (luciferase family)
LLDVALLFGYLFNVKLAGWRLFCAEHCLEPESCWSSLPGYETVQRAERAAKKAAFTQEGAARYLQRLGRGTARVGTAEDVAASLRERLRARAEWWG